ncbi:hypothetical protein C0995_016182 [Termitomyces sp. Mi166|nr:hypothetical protein C0995_016182 [Termitomyces sp. Mi166\
MLLPSKTEGALPLSLKAKHAKKQARKRQKDSQADAENDSPELDELDSDTTKTPVIKKAKTMPLITAYMDTITPLCTTKRKPLTESCRPSFITFDTTYKEFLKLVATCGTSPNYYPLITSINQTQLYWKLSVPLNNKKKPLENANSYKAMIIKLKVIIEKVKDPTITLSLPPFTKVAINLNNSLAGLHEVRQEAEEFCEDLIGIISFIKMDPSLRDFMPAILLVKIFNSQTNMSTHVKEIGMATKAASPVIPAAATSTAVPDLTPAVVPAPATVVVSAPAPAVVPPTFSPMFNPMDYPQMPFFNMLSPPFYSNSMYSYLVLTIPNAPHYFSHASNFPRPQMLQALSYEGTGSTLSSPVKILLSHPILLDEFCIAYEINNEDKEQLEKLKVQPGDQQTDQLECED